VKVNPYYNISSFIGFRTDAERAAYGDVLDFNRNWYDRASYKEFQDYEQVILAFMKKLYQDYFQWGLIAIDSSETIYIALLIHLLRFRSVHGENVRPNFLVSRLGHLVFKKAAVLLNVDLIEVEPEGLGEASIADLKNKINQNTFCVIALAGTTEMGNYDNIVAIDRICKEMNTPLHIDAAIGGFIFPFYKNAKIHKDFSSFKSVLSINISGHKYGYTRPSAAILLLKNRELLPETFYPVTTSYLPGGPSDEYGLMGSKPAIGLIDLHYNISTWGKKGYQKIVEKTFKQKQHLITSLKHMHKKLAIYDSEDTPIFLLYGEKNFIDGLSDGLNRKGWQSSSHYNFFLRKQTIRIVVRKHFTNEYCKSLVKEIKNITQSLQIQP